MHSASRPPTRWDFPPTASPRKARSIVQALHGLIDHATAQQREIDRLVAALERHGIALDDAKREAPKVDPRD